MTATAEVAGERDGFVGTEFNCEARLGYAIYDSNEVDDGGSFGAEFDGDGGARNFGTESGTGPGETAGAVYTADVLDGGCGCLTNRSILSLAEFVYNGFGLMNTHRNRYRGCRLCNRRLGVSTGSGLLSSSLFGGSLANGNTLGVGYCRV